MKHIQTQWEYTKCMIQSKLEQLARILEMKKEMNFSSRKFLKIHKTENNTISALIYFIGLLQAYVFYKLLWISWLKKHAGMMYAPIMLVHTFIYLHLYQI